MLDYSEDGFRKRGIERAKAFTTRVLTTENELHEAKLLDVGCGLGESAAAMKQLYSCEVLGIDPYDRYSGNQFAGAFEYRAFGIEDLPSDYNNHFDFVQSYTVLEHIPDPVTAMEHIYRVLKPGGKAFLVANLWRGANASHVAHAIGNWCHLLMPFEEIQKRCTALGVRAPAPVNKLSYLEYIHHANRIGFDWIRPAWLQWTRMDNAFYQQHIDQLQWYPRVELDMDFLLMALQKSGRSPSTANQYLWEQIAKPARREN